MPRFNVLASVAFAAASLVSLSPARASAQVSLVSEPIPVAQDIVCACVNATKSPIQIRLRIQDALGAGRSCQTTLDPGELGDCTAEGGAFSTASCTVSRTDGAAATTKALICTVSAVAANGDVQAVASVDRRFRQ